MSFQSQLQYIVSWILHVPIENIVMTTDFKQDLKLDLYDFEMMIFQVENCFKKQFSDHEIEQIQTMQDLSILIQNSDNQAIALQFEQVASNQDSIPEMINVY